MENLKNKTIKQFYYDTDDGEIIITMLKTKHKNYYEWLGQVAHYGVVIFLLGGERIGNRTLKETADYCAYTYYDEIIATKGEL